MNVRPRSLRFRAVAPLVLVPVVAWAAAFANDGAPEPPAHDAAALVTPKDVLTTAANRGFRTLTAALAAAGLDRALRGDGPFTLFAPTDEAFARLPAGTIEALLLPANRDRLREILGFHVVEGRVLSTDLLRQTSAKTLAGAVLPIGLRVGSANVTTADLACTNGVLHVIDDVLLPPERPVTRQHSAAAGLVHTAIERGAPLFNAGDVAGCVRTYEETARALLALPEGGLAITDRAGLAKTFAEPAADASARAWDLRRALDRVLENETFEPLIEAPMPTGFPAPGPIGRVVEKSYPAYRAARADGGRASFWTLFQHIQKNDIAMTTPVEMTMGEGMRMERMAFLYEKTAQGAAGTDGAVEVADLPSMKVLSVAMRGTDDPASVALARAAIEKALAARGWAAAGPWRMLGYNSPMVASSRRTWELQLPVAR